MGLLNIPELNRLSHPITGVPGGFLGAAFLEEQKWGSQSRAEPSLPAGVDSRFTQEGKRRGVE